MKTVCISLAMHLSLSLMGQVQIDMPLHLTGPDGSRQVEQLAPPAQENALITVGYATSGTASWAQATSAGSTIHLAMAPAGEGYRDGLLIRFAAPASFPHAASIQVDGAATVPLILPDGLPVDASRITPGTVCEVVYTAPHFILTAPAIRQCPQGSLPMGERLCIDQAEGPVQSFYTSVDHCNERRGRLCTWAEYHTACAALENELTGLFNNWEWVDDTANHTHTMGQVGRNTCMSQRSANMAVNNHGAVRCCYPLP